MGSSEINEFHLHELWYLWIKYFLLWPAAAVRCDIFYVPRMSGHARARASSSLHSDMKCFCCARVKCTVNLQSLLLFFYSLLIEAILLASFVSVFLFSHRRLFPDDHSLSCDAQSARMAHYDIMCRQCCCRCRSDGFYFCFHSVITFIHNLSAKVASLSFWFA